MVTREIKKGVYAVGAADWDRRLFDELIPLPDGTSYNAYLIKGSEKTALIDTVDPTKTHELLLNLKAAGAEKIDYIVANHAEQDHSGSIPSVLESYPSAKVVTNAKCKGMLRDLLPIDEDKFIVIEDGSAISLGDRTLEFIFAPWVHWPETMFTYLKEDRILFTCDFLGSHLATSDLYAADRPKVYEAAKRYYAEIMMPFRGSIKKHLERIAPLAIDIAATSHGPVYDDPKFMTDAYSDWVSDSVKNEVIIPYISMHGSTGTAVSHLIEALVPKGITVKPFNLARTDIGELAIALVDAATIVVATPTVLAGPHPQAMYAAALIGALRPKTRYLGFISSYGWAGKSVAQLEALLANLKAEKLGSVEIKGHPKEADLKSVEALAENIAAKHGQLA